MKPSYKTYLEPSHQRFPHKSKKHTAQQTTVI